MEWLTTKEAAQYLKERGYTVRSHRQKGVSSAPTAHTLKQWCADGKIEGARKEGSKYRGEWMIPQEALDALLAPGSAGKTKEDDMAKRVYNPFDGRVNSDDERRQLQLENSELYERREITKAEYEQAFRQINEAYAAAQERAKRQ